MAHFVRKKREKTFWSCEFFKYPQGFFAKPQKPPKSRFLHVPTLGSNNSETINPTKNHTTWKSCPHRSSMQPSSVYPNCIFREKTGIFTLGPVEIFEIRQYRI